MNIRSLFYGLIVIYGATAWASSYPEQAYHQRVAVVASAAPGMYAMVKSLVMHSAVLGYKPWGALARQNPQNIDASVTARCKVSSGELTKSLRFTLGRDWSGSGGYLSTPFSHNELFDGGCARVDVSITFSVPGAAMAQGNTETLKISSDESSHAAEICDTRENGQAINLKAWECITTELRK